MGKEKKKNKTQIDFFSEGDFLAHMTRRSKCKFNISLDLIQEFR